MPRRYLFTDTGRRARLIQCATDIACAVVVGLALAYLAASFV